MSISQLSWKPTWEQQDDDTIVIKNVRFRDGNYYHIRIEREGTQIPPGFKIPEDHLRLLAAKARTILETGDLTNYFYHSFDQGETAEFSREIKPVKDWTGNQEVKRRFEEIYDLLSMKRGFLSSATPIRAIGPERISTTDDEDDEAVEGEGEKIEIPPASVTASPLAKTLKQALQEEGAIAPHRPDPVEAVIEEDEPEEEEPNAGMPGAGMPGDRTASANAGSPPPPVVPAAAPLINPPLQKPISEDELEPKLDRAGKAGLYSEWRQSPPEAEYKAFLKLCQNPTAKESDPLGVKAWVEKLIRVVYDHYFTRQAIDTDDLPDDVTVDEYRGFLSAMWVIARLLKARDNRVDLEPIVGELNLVKIPPSKLSKLFSFLK